MAGGAVRSAYRSHCSHQSFSQEKTRAPETTAHALFECEFYDAIRPLLIAACLESDISADGAGRCPPVGCHRPPRVATGSASGSGSASGPASADRVLRDSTAFYAKAVSIRLNGPKPMPTLAQFKTHEILGLLICCGLCSLHHRFVWR
jgi:hypothetical protein